MTSTLEIRPESVDRRDLAILERALAKKRGQTARLTGFDGHRIEIPGDLVEALLMIVQQLHTGNGVSIAALRAEVTTAEAADLLNVSRPFVIKLLDAFLKIIPRSYRPVLSDLIFQSSLNPLDLSKSSI